MNILFLTTHCNTGGITRYLLTLSKGLVQNGHKVYLVSSGGNCEGQFKAQGVVCIKANIKTKNEVNPKLCFVLPSLVNLIHKEHIDIIHAQTRVTQTLGTTLSRLTRRPLITTCHGFFKPHFFRRIFPCWGDAVIAISQGVYDHLESDFHVDPKRIHKIYNGIDLSEFVMTTPFLRQQMRKEMDISQSPVIGMIARLSSVKGIDTFIQAIPQILKAFPNALFLIAGEGPEEEKLKHLVVVHGLDHCVRFSPISNQAQRLLHVFDIFVMPSRQEGLGLSVMEAQAAGIAVVASKVGGLVDLIQDGRTGMLVPPEDEHALADAVIRLGQSPDFCTDLTRAARIQIEDKFSSRTMVEETTKVYEQYSRR